MTLWRGSHRELRCRYLIACDGAVSPIRKHLGIAQESLEFDEWWTVVDAWLNGETPLPSMTTQFCLPSGPTTYVVGPRGLRRWELKILPHEDRAAYEHRETINRRLAPFVDTARIDVGGQGGEFAARRLAQEALEQRAVRGSQVSDGPNADLGQAGPGDRTHAPHQPDR